MHRHDPAPFLVGGLTLPEYNLSAIQRLPYVSAAEAIREYEATAPSGAEALRLEREAAKAEAARQKEAHLRAHGEWFQAAPDLLAAIAEVA